MIRNDAGLLPLAPFTSDDGGPSWHALAPRLADRPFLRSEGLVAPLGPPRIAAPWLVEQARELVAVFHRFYRAVADAEGALAARPARVVDAQGGVYERIAEVEGNRNPLPLSRFDCVLTADGRLRVIELNPVGVCTLHLRAISYLEHALLRAGHAAAARAVGTLGALKTASIRRYLDTTLARVPARPRLAVVRLRGMHRGSMVFWKQELAAAGFEAIAATPEQITLDESGARVAGERVDALWLDWLVYLGYQQRRYEQTRFASKVGDFSKASAITEALLGHPALPGLLRDRALTLVSPLRAYRALSKALLAWIEDDALPLAAADRAFLRDHVARTYDHAARQGDGPGAMSVDRARKEREALVLKPCRFGGSHGVVIGRAVDESTWARRLDEIWADPEWVLQTLEEPVAENGATLSHGIYNYGGTLGGILVRAAPSMIVSARTAVVFPAVF